MLLPMQQPVPIVNSTSSPQLEFSEKYTAEHAEKYFSKHQQGFWRTLSTRRRFLLERSEVESEIRQAGMGIIGHVDFLKFFSMWRVYVLSTTGN